VSAKGREFKIKRLMKKAIRRLMTRPANECLTDYLVSLIYRTDFDDDQALNFNRHGKSRRKVEAGEPFRINWVTTDIGTGSGGHTTMLRFISFLESMGVENRVYIFDRSKHSSDAQLKQFIDSNYMPTKNVSFHTEDKELAPAHITFATGWETAYRVYQSRETNFKAYFIQDFEPSFFPSSSLYHFAENTYRMNYFGLCASRWLRDITSEKYAMDACSFNLGYRKDQYALDKSVERNPDQVAVYLRPKTERRGLELVMGVLSNVKKMRPQTRVVLFGSDDIRHLSIPFEAENRGLLNERELCRLFNASAIGLVTSLTNYSLLPIEFMACGALVVDVSVESTKAVFGETSPIALARPDPMSMARKIIHYLDKPEARQEIAENALEFVADFQWNHIHHGMLNDLMNAYFGEAGPEDVRGLPENGWVTPRGGSAIFELNEGKKYLLEEGALPAEQVTEMDAASLLAVPYGPNRFSNTRMKYE